jgi:hypothetical protein
MCACFVLMGENIMARGGSLFDSGQSHSSSSTFFSSHHFFDLNFLNTNSARVTLEEAGGRHPASSDVVVVAPIHFQPGSILILAGVRCELAAHDLALIQRILSR